MKLQFRFQKKLWMSLIELLIVITIIWILIWVLVPTIWNTQWRTRDVTRQTQVQELVAALMSYKLDYWEFPVIKPNIRVWDSQIEQYRWKISLLNDTLVAWWYMTKIPKDPAELSISHPITEAQQFAYDSEWYYIYLSNGKSFVIITRVEDEKNWNHNVTIEDLLDKLTHNEYDDTFKNAFNISKNWNLYIYKYEEEIL